MFGETPESRRLYFEDFFCNDIGTFTGERIWLRVTHKMNYAQVLYSIDGKHYEATCEETKYSFFGWRGGRIGFFTWNDFKEQGYADFEFFDYNFE